MSTSRRWFAFALSAAVILPSSIVLCVIVSVVTDNGNWTLFAYGIGVLAGAVEGVVGIVITLVLNLAISSPRPLRRLWRGVPWLPLVVIAIGVIAIVLAIATGHYYEFTDVDDEPEVGFDVHWGLLYAGTLTSVVGVALAPLPWLDRRAMRLSHSQRSLPTVAD